MKCINCSSSIEEHSETCQYCGSKVGRLNDVYDAPSSVGMEITDNYKGRKQYINRPVFLKNIWFVYKKIAKVTFAFWVMIYFYKWTLPNPAFDIKLRNHILLSPIGGTLWAIRGTTLVVVIPILIASLATWIIISGDSKYFISEKNEVK